MVHRKLISSLCVGLFILGSAFAADKYNLDPTHSNIGFSVRHMGVTNVKGKFSDVSGTLMYDDKDVTKSSVDVTIKATSINTENTGRDNDLRSANFFEVDKYPTATFKGKSVKKTKDGFDLTGTLTIKDVSKEVTIPFTIIGSTKDPYGNTRMGVEGSLKINRKDYHINYNKVLDNGGLIVSDEVKIELDAEWVKPK